jgi:spermidine synthase
MSRSRRDARNNRGGQTRRQHNAAAEPAPKLHSPRPRFSSNSFRFSLLLFASGAAALVYQVLWIKQLSLVVGIEVYAVTTAVSAFFAGLALGGAFFGWLADRVARPLRLYAELEFGAAVTAVATTVALAHAASPFAILENKFGIVVWLPLFVLVAAPASLMGGTLPVLMRAYHPVSEDISRAGGLLYSANTAGAVCGVLAAPFFLVPQLGVRGAAFAAALLNVAAALAAIYLDRQAEPKTAPSVDTEPRINSTDGRVALVLYAIAGGIALGYEVVWSQAIVQFMSTRSFAFAIVLATYLTGLVLGSALYTRFAARTRDPWKVFGILTSAAGLLALLGIAGIGKWFLFFQYYAGLSAYNATASVMAEMCARFLVAALVIVFPATVLLGAAFPAALRLAVDAGYVGRDVGLVVALNTAGGVLGTLFVGFFLIPRLGSVRSLAFLGIAAALLGLVATFRRPASATVTEGSNARPSRRWWPVVAAGVATLCIAVLTPAQKLIQLIPRIHGSAGAVIFHEDDPGGSVAVVEEPAGPNSFRRLYIQGVSNSGDSLPSLRYMRLQAFIPLLIHTGEPHSALVIGLGTGITAGATLQYPGLDRRVCDELMPGVIRSAQLFAGNFGVASDSKIEIRHQDGRRDLLRRDEHYDVITLEPPPPSASGVVNLYSRDFYALAAKRLEPNGILAQWLPIATQNDEDTRSLVRSFLDVFPYASLWSTELHEMLLVGSLQPMTLDLNQIAARFQQPPVAKGLIDVGIDSPAALLATWITDQEGLERYASGAVPVTDDRPRIEYASWVRRGEISRTLSALLALRTPPPVRNADESFWTEVAERREGLLAFYGAGLAAYRGDRERWARELASANGPDARNPYYRWLIGGESAPANSER